MFLVYLDTWIHSTFQETKEHIVYQFYAEDFF